MQICNVLKLTEHGHLVTDEALAWPWGDDILRGFNLSATASAPENLGKTMRWCYLYNKELDHTSLVTYESNLE